MSSPDFSMLDESLGGSSSPASDSDKIPVVELSENEIDPRYLRSSYSTSQLLHACPRKFQLKCLQAERKIDEQTSITFAFGHTVGLGIAEIFATRDLPQTLFKMFLEWEVDFLADDPKRKKSFALAVHSIQKLYDLLEDGEFSEYVVATYNGKPAAELSFRIHFPGKYGTHTYRGYLDLVLQNIMSGEFAVLENKTNSGTWVNHYQYKNSSQALGYGVVLDKIEPDKSAYDVRYLIYMTKLDRWEDFSFVKNYHMRALWLRDRLWDVNIVETLFEHEGNYGIWPMHGESCVAFGKPCEYMDVCHLDTGNLMARLKEDQLVERDRSTGEEATYDFEIPVEELL